jgi:hypothetical protein
MGRGSFASGVRNGSMTRVEVEVEVVATALVRMP